MNNEMIPTIEHKRHHSITKSFEDNITMKRKISLTNSDISHTSKKLDVVKSTEFEPKDHADISRDESVNIDRDNDLDDYADRIFDYLGEAYSTQSTSSFPQLETNQINSSDKEIKPFLCAFCPYFARNIHDFQTHIAKHTEKNFRCLLCNCMYKYRRDCVTHMKRKHSNTVTGSISQYIQKINSTATANNNCIQPSSSTPSINPNLFIEPKRYGCPYCSLMTKSTSSIYKHQSRKHASFPKVVHKYSTDDPTTRSLVAILKQKSIKKPILQSTEGKIFSQFYSISISSSDEQLCKPQSPDPSYISSSSSLIHHHTESFPLVNRHRCAASKHITAHTIHSSNGRLSKLFQCCLCGYRARHRSNVVRHVKKIHTIDLDETKALTDNEPDSHSENLPNYSFNTIVQAPIILNKTDGNDQTKKPYADIHLSINIFLPNKNQQNSFDQITSDCSNSEDNPNDIYSDDEISDNDNGKIHISSSHQQNLSSGSLYKPHKCRRCFYRSNWKTDMLHHIRLKHHINHATKSDYITMDFDSALRSFSEYEKTFGKVLKNRLLLPKIDYIDCTWEELKRKLFHNISPSSTTEQTTIINNTYSSMNNEEQKQSIDRQ